MPANPFRAVPRTGLILLLVLLIILECAGGAGLYLSNRSASAAPATPRSRVTPVVLPTADYKGPPVLTVQNFPRTVLAGHKETFSVRLKGLPNVLLKYTISYPDGHQEGVDVLTDGTGYSKHAFLIKIKLPPGQRETIGIGVSYGNKLQASTRFAVQGPEAPTAIRR
ncbi:MAG: hypothetical protein ACRDG4_00805 [Chloroflexota bacterium]